MMNGSGMILLTGESGIGKTETLRAAAAVATESGPAHHPDLTAARWPHQPGANRCGSWMASRRHFSSPPRKALLADDLELLPHDCITCCWRSSRPEPADQGGSAIILSSSGAELSRPDLAEFSALSRNTVRLARLGPAEVRQYIERSLWIAGGTTRRLITPDAMKLIIARSDGAAGGRQSRYGGRVDGGFARGDVMITAKTVDSVIGPPPPRPRPRPDTREPADVKARSLQIVAAGLLVAGASVFLYKGLATQATERTMPQVRRPSPPALRRAVAQPASGPAPSTPPAEPRCPPALMAALMNRGNEALGLGDIASARLLFQRAAEAGNAALRRRRWARPTIRISRHRRAPAIRRAPPSGT